MEVAALSRSQLTAVTSLLGAHLSAAVPGWKVTEAHLERSLRIDRTQPLLDPWVTSRFTLVASQDGRIKGAAHLKRFGSHAATDYRDAVDICWMAFFDHQAGADLLRAAVRRARRWGARRVFAFDSGPPVPALSGICDVWPHIREAVVESGFAQDPRVTEKVFAGPIRDLGEDRGLGFDIRRRPHLDPVMEEPRLLFEAFDGDVRVGWAKFDLDLLEDEPAMARWVELEELHVVDGHRSRGAGTALMEQASRFLRLMSKTSVVLVVGSDDEARGAGRFYERFGLVPLTRSTRGWVLNL